MFVQVEQKAIEENRKSWANIFRHSFRPCAQSIFPWALVNVNTMFMFNLFTLAETRLRLCNACNPIKIMHAKHELAAKGLWREVSFRWKVLRFGTN